MLRLDLGESAFADLVSHKGSDWDYLHGTTSYQCSVVVARKSNDHYLVELTIVTICMPMGIVVT